MFNIHNHLGDEGRRVDQQHNEIVWSACSHVKSLDIQSNESPLFVSIDGSGSSLFSFILVFVLMLPN